MNYGITRSLRHRENFGETKVLKDISLTLEQGEALAIIGSSGSGKTTLLRCLNFLERLDTGVIRVNGETMWDAADPATQRESEVRKSASTSASCSRTSTSSPSTPRWKT